MAKPHSSRAGIAQAGRARAGYLNPNKEAVADNPLPQKSEPVSEQLLPLSQGNSFEVAAQVVRANTEQQRRNSALIGSMGFNTTQYNQAPISGAPVSGGERLNPEGAIYRDTTSTASASAPVDEVVELLQKLRGFYSGIEVWITELRAQMRNGPEDHAKDLSLISFLENLARGIAEVADGIEQAISQGRNGAAEPILLGKAANAARAVSETALKWLEEQGTNVIDAPVKLGLFGSTLVILSHFGLSGDAITGVVAGFVLGAAIKK